MDALDSIRVVLVSPIYGGNVGSVCRAMKNMGLSHLALAAPRRLDELEAKKMAHRAADIFRARREFTGLAEAVADCAMVVGTTARRGLYRQHSRSPREWAPRILEAAQTGKVALVFGPEDRGLTNEELAFCNHLIRIPSSEKYLSLNVSQAALVCCYEIFVAAGACAPNREKAPPASSDLQERMFALWEKALLAVGFMKEDKAMHMMLGVRRVLSRGVLTVDDVHIMMGIARQALWAAQREKESSHGSR